MRHCERSRNLKNEKAMAHVGRQRHRKNIKSMIRLWNYEIHIKYIGTCYGSISACRPPVTLRHIFKEVTPSRKKTAQLAIRSNHFYEKLALFISREEVVYWKKKFQGFVFGDLQKTLRFVKILVGNNKDSTAWYLLRTVTANIKFGTYTATIWILHLYRSHSRWILRCLHFLGAQSFAASTFKHWNQSTRLQGETLYEAENLRVSVLFKQTRRLTCSPPVVGFGSVLTSSQN